MRYTLSAADRRKINSFIRDRYIPEGVGSEEAACSIASINLALYGQLTDDIPNCMCRPLGHWIIATQDEMNEDTRNSPEWKYLLQFAAGTGRKHEAERQRMINEWNNARRYEEDEEGGFCYESVDEHDPVGFLRRLIEVSHIIPEPIAKKVHVPCLNCA